MSGVATPIVKETHLTDGRVKGDWITHYPRLAWFWIAAEFLYLLGGLTIGLVGLYEIAASAHPGAVLAFGRPWFVGLPHSTLTLAAIAASGWCGGCSFALKWLYHGVAHGKWHQDRLIWRLVVPLLSGVLALFSALMICSGIIPILNAGMVRGPRVGTAFGFFVGFFSDNLLAALQKVADQVLGTLARNEEREAPSNEP